MSAEIFSLPNGRRDARDSNSAHRNEALAWIAAAEAWLKVPREPNFTRAREALSRAWWCAAEGSISEGFCGCETVHGIDPEKAPALEAMREEEEQLPLEFR